MNLNFKRTAALVMALTIVASATMTSVYAVNVDNQDTSIVAFATEKHTYTDEEGNTITVEKIDDSTAYLAGVEMASGNTSLTLPTTCDYGTVVSVKKSALKGNTTIKELTIPESYTSIEESAFESCIALEKVVVNDSVQEIAKSAFKNCYKLSYVKLPSELGAIRNSCFTNCYALESFTVPASVNVIEASAFENCYGLAVVEFKEENPSIDLGAKAFANCAALDNLMINGDTSQITFASTTFNNCYPSINCGIDHVVTYNGYNYGLWQTLDGIYVAAFLGILENAEEISEDTQGTQSEIAGSAVLPDEITFNDTDYTVRKIGKYCEQVADGIYEGTVTTINIPDTVISIGLVMTNRIDPVALPYFDGLETFTGGKNLLCINKCAFEHASLSGDLDLTSMSKLTYIGRSAFVGLEDITSVELPKGLKALMKNAFYDCEAVTSITFNSSSMDIIGDWAIPTWSLEQITFPKKVTKFGEELNNLSVFFDGAASNLQVVELPSNTANINTAIFGGGMLRKINLADTSVTTICENAFESTQLQMVELPSTITSIGSGAFAKCESLEVLKIGSSSKMTSIPDNLCSYCTSLHTVQLSNKIESIASNAFGACRALKNIYIPKTCGTIEESAFAYDNSETDEALTVYYQSTKSDWNSINIVETGNEKLLNAAMNYSSKFEVTIEDEEETTEATEESIDNTDETSETSETTEGTTTEPTEETTTEHSEETTEEPATEPSEETTTEPSEESTTEHAEETTDNIYTYRLGDVNCDDVVDVRDVVLMNKAITGVETLNHIQNRAADVDKDGSVTSVDSLTLMKYVVGLITFE